MRIALRPLAFFCLILIAISCKEKGPPWPSITNQQKPWTRWWWHGSALTKEGITLELEAYSKGGLGGVEITPIYGVHGYEDKFVEFLSDGWMELLIHTLKEADRLGLGVDMATGTGWPFGGPWVSDRDACKNFYHKVYSVNGGESLREKIEFIQPPYLRAVGSQVYEVHDNAAAEGRVVAGTRKEPHQMFDPKNIRIEQLKQPVSANNNLQALALDQVQFERPLPVVALMAYGNSGESLDLTSAVDSNGVLDWVAPQGNWKLYAVFEGSHGKMVERAGPGGEGNVIDHFSSQALSNYLQKFDSAFSRHDITSLRAFFNDSYEVDDARGAADWTPSLIAEFSKRRGYSLLQYLPSLFGDANSEQSERILFDYRLTISELLLENFTQPWAQWAHNKNKIVRNQAHGAPSNILDLYAAIDIPETEGVEPLRIKMATSAGHVTGKKLISSESATWLDEHFLSGPGDVKANVDRYMLNGVNHILYHGTSYSPPGEPWPGWLFYAAVHINPRNPQWNDYAALNRYIARCQSFLQQGAADNDVLLYYPIADRFSFRGEEMVEHFDSPVNAFKGSAFLKAADTLLSSGYAFDFISDKQLQQLQLIDGMLLATGGGRYKTVVVPECKYIPIGTLRKLQALARDGAKVIFYEGLPESVAGFANLEANQVEFQELVMTLTQSNEDGGVPIGDDLISLLSEVNIEAEPMTSLGISYTRRKLENGNQLYLVGNTGKDTFEGWVPLKGEGASIVIRDPMTSQVGNGQLRERENGTSTFLQIKAGQTLILELGDASTSADFQFLVPSEPVQKVDSGWQLDFVNGEPIPEASFTIDTLTVWTALPYEWMKSFSGTGVYSTSFRKPGDNPPALSSGRDASDGWILSLGSVHGSVTIILNGDSLATLIGEPYEVWLDAAGLKEDNELQLRVSNLMANQIADLDKRGVQWKKFYNVNFPARKPENRRNGIFYSGDWTPLISGLDGPVLIAPAKRVMSSR